MKKLNALTKSVLLTTLFAAATPALADNDELIYAQNQSQYITHEAAAAKALAKVGGGQVTDVEFEYDGFPKAEYFDVEVINSKGIEYDVRIDARTGKVLSSHRDW